MNMNGLNAVTVFVAFAFIVAGFIGLAGLTDPFDRAEGVLFLATGIAVSLLSYYRSRTGERNTG